MAEKTKKGLYGDPMQIDPDTALLMELQRTAGHVQWLYETIQQWGEERGDRILFQYTDAAGMGKSAVMQLYMEERNHLVRVAKACIDTGLAKRQVDIAQSQAQIIAMVMLAFVQDPRLGLTYQQQASARKLMREHLERAPMEAPELPRTIDVEVVEDDEEEELL